MPDFAFKPPKSPKKSLEDTLTNRASEVKRVLSMKPDCSEGRHLGNPCKNCGTQLCTHSHSSLRGCKLPAGHSGSHYNAWSSDGKTWKDNEGGYINSHEDWENHVDQLGRTKN